MGVMPKMYSGTVGVAKNSGLGGRMESVPAVQANGTAG
jgi:hypothetical protein